MNSPVDVSFFTRAAKPLTSYRPYWAKRFGTAPFLPMSRAEMDQLGWDSCDIVLVTGDLNEALALSDRIGVMFNGALAGMIDRGDDEGIERIPQLMAGVQHWSASQSEPSEGEYDSAVS